jgi:hypothetical protein
VKESPNGNENVEGGNGQNNQMQNTVEQKKPRLVFNEVQRRTLQAKTI